MSYRHELSNRKSTTLLFFAMVGAVAFSLSSLPHSGSEEPAATFELSSNSGACDYARQLDQTGTSMTCNAEQNINSKRITGTVKVEVIEEEIAHRLTNPTAAPTKERRLQVSMDLATECEEGCTDGRRRTSASFGLNINRLSELNAMIEAQFKENAKKLTAEEETAKRTAKLVQECQIDSEGNKVSESQRLDCRIRAMGEMSEEKAAEYYEKYIQPEVESLVTSDNVRDQRRGTALLTKLGRGGVGGRFVRESVGDLKKFQQYKAQALQAKNNIAQMSLNDPRRAAAVAAFQNGENTANAYFRSRGIQAANQTWPASSNFDYAGSMTNDLERYQAQLQQTFQTYDQIIAQHGQMVGGDGLNSQYTPAGQGPGQGQGLGLGQGPGPGQGTTATSPFPNNQRPSTTPLRPISRR